MSLRTQTGWLALLALWAPFAAQARDLWSTDGGVKLEGQAFYKSFATSVWLQPEMVRGTRALETSIDEARALAPPEWAAALPSSVALPDNVLLQAHLVRASARASFKDKVALDVAWQSTLAMASQAGFTSGASLTGTVGGASAVGGAQRRVWELAWVLVDQNNLRLEHSVDRLAVEVALPFGDLTVGRQVLSWGTGRLWNPTDVLSPFPPTVVDREVRRGFDAVRLAVALGDLTQLDLLFLPQVSASDMGGVARFRSNFAGWDGSVSVGKYVSDMVIGADASGDLGPLGVHAEGAYTMALQGLGALGASVSVGEHFFRGVAGIDWRPWEKVVLMAEYHFNGFGADDPSGSAAKLAADRVRRGEVFGAGRHYGGVVVSYLASELFTASLSALANVADPSVLLIPALEYWFEQSVIVRAGGYVPLGAAPAAEVLSGVSARDILEGREPFKTAIRTLGLRSEYGASAWGAFVQVGLFL